LQTLILANPSAFSLDKLNDNLLYYSMIANGPK
jgi:hypothetical protein